MNKFIYTQSLYIFAVYICGIIKNTITLKDEKNCFRRQDYNLDRNF